MDLVIPSVVEARKKRVEGYDLESHTFKHEIWFLSLAG